MFQFCMNVLDFSHSRIQLVQFRHFVLVSMVDEGADKEAVRISTGESNGWFDVTVDFINMISK